MSFTEREKAAEKALRKLTTTLMRMLSPDIRHELYARNALTWIEKERVETAAKRSGNAEGVEAILSTLRRYGPHGLDVLVESLQVEESANQVLISKIRMEWPTVPVKDVIRLLPVSPGAGPLDAPTLQAPITPEAKKEFLGNGVWPFTKSSTSSETPVIPPPPQEDVDYAPLMVYKMSSRPRGVAVIINNKNFTCILKDRVGTDRDAEALTKLFIHLGFHTDRFNDLNGKDMNQKLEDIAGLDHTQFDCLIVAILTHGINGKLYSTDGDLLAVEDVTKLFAGNNCPSLIGKPKVFILQACRGGKFDYGVENDSTDGPGTEELSEEKMKEVVEGKYDQMIAKAMGDDETDGGGYARALPLEADFILAYATVPGYVAWWNSEYGSWFIKAFVDTMLELLANEHFLDILTEVNRRMAEQFQYKGHQKQIPAPVIMLTRKLYFRPGSFE